MANIINSLLKAVFGDKSKKELKEITPVVNQINEEFAALSGLSHDELRKVSEDLKAQIKAHIQTKVDEAEALKDKVKQNPEMDFQEKDAIFNQVDQIEKDINAELEVVLLEILPKAFALMKETAKRFSENKEIRVRATEMDRALSERKNNVTIDDTTSLWANTWDANGSEITWNMVHYDVQLIGGYALHTGKVAEMQTGEGKTLVATLPVFLNALAGRGVHVVTVNDYLAKRDSEWMAPIFEFHGLSVDCIDRHQPNSEARRKAYLADITYGTNNEFGFDYLRDNMAPDPNGLVQRKHHYAIVDEVDSVLIDDARTPLIISGPTPNGDKQEYDALKPRVEQLYNTQRAFVTQILTEAKKLLAGHDQPGADKEKVKEGSLLLFRAHRGLPKNKALIKFLSEPGIKALMQKTENYYMAEQNKHMHIVDNELYFVIEEKSNSVDLTEKGVDLISGSEDPQFFILPEISSAIDAIEKSANDEQQKLQQKDELLREYSQKSERIHTVNQLLKAYALFEKDIEYVVMDGKVMIVDEQTGRIMEGRRYSDGLHQAIESKEKVKVEAATQTYATVTLQNYFRMYHKLSGMTGTAITEANEFWSIYELDVMVIPTNKPVVRNDQEDKVYKTKREKYNAIIDEIAALRDQGRPVLVGTTSVEVSELLGKMLNFRKIPHNVLNAKLHKKEAEVVTEAGKKGAVTIATNMAGRGTDIKISDEIKELGGLAIIGSEKHDSRRVDRQLRGRSGRQGDPGSSQFYLSLEDDLMRLFNSDRVASIMDRLGLEEGEVIQHSMITKSIERAQKKVEENNFGVRKRLLEFDDVMNAQREVIYKRRRHALYGERLGLDISNMFFEVAATLTADFISSKDFEGFKLELIKQLNIECPVEAGEFVQTNIQQITRKVYDSAYQKYLDKKASLARMTVPVIKNVHDDESNNFENILVPFTNGTKGIQVSVNIDEGVSSEGKQVLVNLEKNVTLSIIDNEWKEHLRELDDLRTSVQGAVYEQKDPLLIYKLESYEAFKRMITRLNFELVSFLTHAVIPVNQNAQAAQAPVQSKQPKTIESKPSTEAEQRRQPQEQMSNKPNYIDPTAAPQAPLSRRDRRKKAK